MELQEAEQQRDQEEDVEAHGPVNDVAVGQLHLHVLPGLPRVPPRHPHQPAHQRDGDSLHERSSDHQNQNSKYEAQHGRAHQAAAEDWHGEWHLVRSQVRDQTQTIVDLGSQGNAGTWAQNLSSVAPWSAPGV